MVPERHLSLHNPHGADCAELLDSTMPVTVKAVANVSGNWFIVGTWRSETGESHRSMTASDAEGYGFIVGPRATAKPAMTDIIFDIV